MKRVYYLAVLCLFAIGCSEPSEETGTRNRKRDERQLILVNKIQKITEYTSNVHLSIEEKEHVERIKMFDEKGCLLKETAFLENGMVDYVNTLEYDNQDRVIKQLIVNGGGHFHSKEIRTYDSINRTRQVFHWDKEFGSYLVSNILYLDSLGRSIKADWFWPTGARAVEGFKYDGMRLIENWEYDFWGRFQYRWEYRYDSLENKTEEIQYYPDSSIVYRVLNEYDKDNQLVKVTRTNRGSLQYMATFEYDKRHLLIAKTEYSTPGRVSKKYRYVYESF